MSVEFKAVNKFDSEKNRQYINDELIVFHCHHYSTLFCQLADDAKLLNGPTLLSEAAEESMFPALKKYYAINEIESVEDRARIAEEYFAYIGMGQLNISYSENSGTAEMLHSHVDEGWIKKWSNRETPVNFIGQGFLAAAFSAISGNETGTFKVNETQSIVSGASTSKFSISRK